MLKNKFLVQFNATLRFPLIYIPSLSKKRNSAVFPERPASSTNFSFFHGSVLATAINGQVVCLFCPCRGHKPHQTNSCAGFNIKVVSVSFGIIFVTLQLHLHRLSSDHKAFFCCVSFSNEVISTQEHPQVPVARSIAPCHTWRSFF